MQSLADSEWPACHKDLRRGLRPTQTHKAHILNSPIPSTMPVQGKPFIKRPNNNQVSPSTHSAAAVGPLAPKVATEPRAGKPPAATPSKSYSRAKQNDATPSTLRTAPVVCQMSFSIFPLVADAKTQNNGNDRTMPGSRRQAVQSSTPQHNIPRPANAETRPQVCSTVV